MTHRSLAGLVAVCAALLAAGCAPATDRDQYQAGETGTVTFRNATGIPLYLAGCGHFDYEKQVGAAWVSQGPSVVCVWQGFAQPVPPRGAVSEPVEAREPGTWRLRYAVGAGCSASAPLDGEHCRWLGEITSNEFVVDDAGCATGGCSGQLCGEAELAGQLVTTCEWRAEYACYRAARCGRFGPGGTCAWEPTPELLACLADPPPLAR